MKTEDIHYVGFLSKLLETKIMQVLRFKYGQVKSWAPEHHLDLIIRFNLVFNEYIILVLQVYSVNVSVFLGGNKPSRSGDVRGDISVNFSCDPDMSSKLV